MMVLRLLWWLVLHIPCLRSALLLWAMAVLSAVFIGVYERFVKIFDVIFLDVPARESHSVPVHRIAVPHAQRAAPDVDTVLIRVPAAVPAG